MEQVPLKHSPATWHCDRGRQVTPKQGSSPMHAPCTQLLVHSEVWQGLKVGSAKEARSKIVRGTQKQHTDTDAHASTHTHTHTHTDTTHNKPVIKVCWVVVVALRSIWCKRGCACATNTDASQKALVKRFAHNALARVLANTHAILTCVV